MIFDITHETIYDFSSEVFLEPHQLRFKPKNTSHVILESFDLHVFPNPTGLSESIDPENNFFHFAWFEGMYSQLKIVVKLKVISHQYNPFNFILYPDEYFTVPFQYSQSLKDLLQPSLQIEGIGDDLILFGEKIRAETKGNTVEFLTKLNSEMHKAFVVEIREEGEPLNPNTTFDLKKGSCRDLAWMQIQLLRHMGIAARFVSGYFYLLVENPEFELHAWIEVFLPGAGWVGFDPSHGIVAGNSHIPIASSAHFKNTMPVIGTIRGTAISTLKTNLHIEKSK